MTNNKRPDIEGYQQEFALDSFGEALAILDLCAYALELEKENAALAAWQCPFQDGKSGLTSDEHGHQYCAKEKRIAALLPAAVVMVAQAYPLTDLSRAEYDAAREAVEQEGGGDESNT